MTSFLDYSATWSPIWTEAANLPAQYSPEDPLDIATGIQLVQSLQTDWHEGAWIGNAPLLTDKAVMAVSQALRTGLLSARNNLKVNALMSQKLRNLPPDSHPLEVYLAELEGVQKNHPSYKYLPTLTNENLQLATRIALYDVFVGGGNGKIWREEMIGRKLDNEITIKGYGMKIASFAWLLLQPTTSQLGTIDAHMVSIIKHHFPDDPVVQACPQDAPKNDTQYLEMERRLLAMKIAKGYVGVPLGAYQWAEWDFFRTGPGYDPGQDRYYENKGWHQEHNVFRVIDPQSVEEADWAKEYPSQPRLKKDEYQVPIINERVQQPIENYAPALQQQLQDIQQRYPIQPPRRRPKSNVWRSSWLPWEV